MRALLAGAGLTVWTVVATAAGVLIGKGIERADRSPGQPTPLRLHTPPGQSVPDFTASVSLLQPRDRREQR